MVTYVKFDVRVETYNTGGYDPEDEWSRDSSSGEVSINRATISNDNYYHNRLGIEADLKVGDIIYLVWAQYTTGDSFGNDGGQYELIQVFTDPNLAFEHKAKMESIKEGDKDQYSVAWIF